MREQVDIDQMQFGFILEHRTINVTFIRRYLTEKKNLPWIWWFGESFWLKV